MNDTPSQRLSRNPSSAGYSNPLRSYSVPATDNPDGTINVPAQPVFLIDPTMEPITPTKQVFIGNPANPASNVGVSTLFGTYGVSFQGLQTDGALNVAAVQTLYNPAAVASVAGEWARTPSVFKSATVAAATGSTDVWTPAAGKKFRLMGYSIHFAGTAAAVGLRTFSIQQETLGDIGINTGTLAPAAGTGAENSSIVVHLPGNGYLATVADKKLQVVTGTTAYNVGADYISVWGTEE